MPVLFFCCAFWAIFAHGYYKKYKVLLGFPALYRMEKARFFTASSPALVVWYFLAFSWVLLSSYTVHLLSLLVVRSGFKLSKRRLSAFWGGEIFILPRPCLMQKTLQNYGVISS